MIFAINYHNEGAIASTQPVPHHLTMNYLDLTHSCSVAIQLHNIANYTHNITDV